MNCEEREKLILLIDREFLNTSKEKKKHLLAYIYFLKPEIIENKHSRGCYIAYNKMSDEILKKIYEKIHEP